MPIFRRLPKRGFSNVAFRDVFGVVNIDELEKRFESGSAVNEKLLRGAGLVRGKLDGIKILGRGELTKAFHVEADAVSASAREKIEKAGGSVLLSSKAKAAAESQ